MSPMAIISTKANNIWLFDSSPVMIVLLKSFGLQFTGIVTKKLYFCYNLRHNFNLFIRNLQFSASNSIEIDLLRNRMAEIRDCSTHINCRTDNTKRGENKKICFV